MVADRRSWHPGQPRSGSVSCAFRCRCGVCARDPRRRRGAAGACVQPRPWRPRGHGGGHARAPCGARAGGDRGREPTPELAVEMRRRYRLIGGSPLVDITRAQAEALADVLGTDFRVRAGMRFSEPAIESEVDALVAEGAKRIVGVPMSPQWSDRLMAGYERAVAESSPVPFAIARSWWCAPSFVAA